jgi:hypothetical protein
VLFVAVLNSSTFSTNIEYGSWLRGETALCGVKSVTAGFLMEIRVEGEFEQLRLTPSQLGGCSTA